MSVLFMLGWWYQSGWGWALSQIEERVKRIGKTFAVSMLLKTLFSPWKQLSTTSTFSTFFQTLIDNSISRGIGFVIRLSILLFVCIWTLVVVVFGVLIIILWPFIPLSVIIFPILAGAGLSL